MGICPRKSKRRIMEELLEKVETLIDDIEGDPQLTKKEILESLRNIKDKAEDIHYSLDI
jgi:uncharacterized protein (UPF0216 family)